MRRPWMGVTMTLSLLLIPMAPGRTRADDVPEAEAVPPADAVAERVADPTVRALVREVLARNPDVAAAAAEARSARRRAPVAGAFPDPTLGATAFVLPPESRVGPQRASASVSQKVPWAGKRRLREEATLLGADALEAKVEALRLDLVTETRRLAYEIAFLDAYRDVVRMDRETLGHYEDLARTRYASGVGTEQSVIKIQAEITRDDARLLDIATRRATAVAALDALRDRPQDTAIPDLALPRYPGVSLDLEHLRSRALALRPELGGADAEIARSDSLLGLALKERAPDVTFGLNYVWVGTRDDPAGRAAPPPDNGDDILGVSATINLPVWRGRLEAGVDEASERRRSAVERKRAVTARIDQALGELTQRARLTWDQVTLFDKVLSIQADQSLRSAEAGYAAGTLEALDLLDAERVLLEVRTGSRRAQADYAIALARIEGAVGEPLVPEQGAKGDQP